VQNLVTIGSLGRLGEHPNFGRTFWAIPFLIFFGFFAQRPGRIARRTATNEGSKRVFPAKEVPFGGLNNVTKFGTMVDVDSSQRAVTSL